MDVQEAVFISPLPGGAWDNRKVGSVWEEPPAGGLPRTTPNLNILMARVSAITPKIRFLVNFGTKKVLFGDFTALDTP